MPIYGLHEEINSTGGGSIFLSTEEGVHEEGFYGNTNLEIIYGKNEVLEKLADYDDTREGIFDKYKFYNSGLVILVEKEVHGGEFDPSIIEIVSPFFKVRDTVDSLEIITQLKSILDKIVLKSVKALKNSIRMVEKVGLGSNIESRIAEFVSGKKGSTAAQQNKLEQQRGVSLAPRAGGKRKTVRNRK